MTNTEQETPFVKGRTPVPGDLMVCVCQSLLVGHRLVKFTPRGKASDISWPMLEIASSDLDLYFGEMITVISMFEIMEMKKLVMCVHGLRLDGKRAWYRYRGPSGLLFADELTCKSWKELQIKALYVPHV